MSYRLKNSGSRSIITNTTDHHQSSHQLDQTSKTNISSDEQTSSVRSRWSPKPEQILILESVFNSGMVNPPKDETMRIRMLLESFGPVGDANVFYWFQNRRSKSRRLQRQIQSNMMKANNTQSSNLNNVDPYLISSSSESTDLSNSGLLSTAYSCLNGGFSSSGTLEGFHDMDDIGSLATADASSSSLFCAYDVTNSYMQNQQQGRVVGDDQGSGVVTVFINGVLTEVPTGPVDIKEMITCGGGGQDLVLLHSSGHQVPINEYGFSYNSLQHGESYFLVDRST